jgi:hypothetical protein
MAQMASEETWGRGDHYRDVAHSGAHHQRDLPRHCLREILAGGARRLRLRVLLRVGFHLHWPVRISRRRTGFFIYLFVCFGLDFTNGYSAMQDFGRVRGALKNGGA